MLAEPHLTGLGREQAEQGLQQRGLAAAIGAEQSQHLSGAQTDIEPATDDAVAIADGEAAALQHHGADHSLETLASSQMKKGVPTKAVRMPSGISIGAMVRASVSIASRKPPPISAAAGISRPKSGPTNVRAIC